MSRNGLSFLNIMIKVKKKWGNVLEIKNSLLLKYGKHKIEKLSVIKWKKKNYILKIASSHSL